MCVWECAKERERKGRKRIGGGERGMKRIYTNRSKETSWEGERRSSRCIMIIWCAEFVSHSSLCHEADQWKKGSRIGKGGHTNYWDPKFNWFAFKQTHLSVVRPRARGCPDSLRIVHFSCCERTRSALISFVMDYLARYKTLNTLRSMRLAVVQKQKAMRTNLTKLLSTLCTCLHGEGGCHCPHQMSNIHSQ